jgi:hypothetical protein
LSRRESNGRTRHDEGVPRRRPRGDFKDYKVEAGEGMVILDVVHRIQATQAAGSRVPLELQGRQVRLVQRGDQRQAALMCMTRMDLFQPGETITSRRSGRSRRSRPRDRRLVQLREGQADPAVRLKPRTRTARTG